MTAKFTLHRQSKRDHAHGIGNAWDISLDARSSELEQLVIRVIDALDSAGRLQRVI